MFHALRTLGIAFIAVSVLPSATQLVDAVHWDRPKADPYGHSPDTLYDDNAFNDTYPLPEGITQLQDGDGTQLITQDAGSFYLRIMPLGASITQGQASTDDNGYRKALRQQLRWKGWKVNMVGSQRKGNMADNDNEGWPGYTVNGVYAKFRESAHLKPNLVLINAGTNDCGTDGDGANAAADMKAMLNGIFASIPSVTIILSTLLPNKNNNACSAFVSAQYRDLVRNDFAGRKIGLADIFDAMGGDPNTDLFFDHTHPNDAGYKLFAAVWWDAISNLESIFTPPADNGIDDSASTNDNTCKKVAGNARGPIQTQKGSGEDDGPYRHISQSLGEIQSGRIEYGADSEGLTDLIPGRMFFANIVKNYANAERAEALDDWIRVYNNGDDEWLWYVRVNKGNAEFEASQRFTVAQDCRPGANAHGFTWADFNGDGLDDFFCLKYDGGVTVSFNRGGNPPKFEYGAQVIGGAGPDSWDYTKQNLQFADIDGDGRADFCILSSTDVRCSRNGGSGDTYIWQGFAQVDTIRDYVFTERTGMDPTKMFLGDINGDFRADLLTIGDNGNVETWINQRGVGNGIRPDWYDAGITHVGQTVSSIAHRIKFGKIMGSNRLDYIYLKKEKTYNSMLAWENKGEGGTKLKGDGTFYCDMLGNGRDDLVWIFDAGIPDEINVNILSPPEWGHDHKISFSVPGPRVGIHLADWNGDGRCDILVQNKGNGAISLWENQYDKAAKSITFASRGVVASPGCTAGWGVSIFDRGMRIADLDGDGRADIICLEEDGSFSGWLNRAGGMLNVGQVKFAESWDRANIRFADVEKSGRADIIWVNRYNGAGTVFKNLGYKGVGAGPGGSSFQWLNRGILYAPINRGETMNFANLGGLGRADLVHIVPATNAAFTNFNHCGAAGGSGGDDGPIEDPGLPFYVGPPQGATPEDQIILEEPAVTITLDPFPNATPTPPPEITENSEQLDLGELGKHNYYYVDKSCSGPISDENDVDKGAFVTTAWKDAVTIFQRGRQWPGRFRGSADVYVGKGFENSAYADVWQKNIAAAADWGTGSPGWLRSYVRIRCDDWLDICNNKVGKDPRPIGGYANETRGTFGTYYYITLCSPFWDLPTMQHIQERESDPFKPSPSQMQYMVSAGTVVVHEVMHLSVASENRKPVLDQTFFGGKKIYGVKDVAKAARITAQEGFDLNYRNADTYAIFMQAAYWEDVFNEVIPPSIDPPNPAPAGYVEWDYVTDSSTNYVLYVEDESTG